MNNRIVKKVKNAKFMNQFPGLNLGSLVVILLCSFLIVIATFTPIPILKLAIPQEAFINSSNYFVGGDSISKISKIFYYIPQIPVLLMIAAILGPRLGLLPVIIYIAAGLTGLPVFAGGGGMNYYTQFGFGYILGFCPGLFFAGNILRGKLGLFTFFRATFTGITIIHAIGILYIIIALFISREPFFNIINWIWQSSGIQFFYDLIFGVIAVIIGRLFRKILWIAMD